MPNWGRSKHIETKPQINCFSLIKAFLKNKKRSETSLHALFIAQFFIKKFHFNWRNFIFCLPLLFLKHPFWDSPFCLITDDLVYTYGPLYIQIQEKLNQRSRKTVNYFTKISILDVSQGSENASYRKYLKLNCNIFVFTQRSI